DLPYSAELTGLSTSDTYGLLAWGEDAAVADADDEHDQKHPTGQAVTRLGDMWRSEDGRQTLINGDSLKEETYARLLGGQMARLVVVDAPFNVSICKLAGGRGRAKRREFAQASGEMSPQEFRTFLHSAMTLMSRFSMDGSLAYYFMDWRHIEEIMSAGRAVYDDYLNMCVWRKTTAGMGGLYRNQHELCFLFKKGAAPHVNNVLLGRHGRNRSNIWTHAGANTFRKGRDADLEAHPTVKPVRMIADIILDASHRNDLILDGFVGSGTALLAAHRTGRRGAGIELDPLYCDVAVRRLQTATGMKFVHADTGESFDDRAAAASVEA
ncbi:MAG: methylase, partial [Caulobacteraceae bacterium]|nr:methylase [Caulobacteraceae bacterium]